MPARLTIETFLERARCVHGDKYDYSNVVYVNKDTKVAIICPEHGLFYQTPHNHAAGKGCPKCVANYKLTQDDFIRKAKEVHGTNYDYTKTVYTKNAAKVIITCPMHGDFEQEANSHLQGHGCPVCGKMLQGGSLESRILRVKHIQETCNLKYGITNPMKMKSVVEKNEESKKKNKSYGTSKPENKLYSMLIQKFGVSNVKRQYKSDVYPFACDFYVISLDMYIEFNGIWTHGCHWFDESDENDLDKLSKWRNKKTKYYDTAISVWTVRDRMKLEAAKKHNLNYVVFWDNKLIDVKEWFSIGCPVKYY